MLVVKITIAFFLIFCNLHTNATDDESSVTCENGGSPVNEPLTKTCACFDQYFEGERCEIVKRYCTRSTCRNGGTCSDHPGGFVCICHHGFYGQTCSNRTDGAYFGSNPLVLIPTLEVASNKTSTKVFIVMEELPMNETIRLTMTTQTNKSYEFVFPEDNYKFAMVSSDENDDIRRRMRRDNVKGVDVGSHVIALRVPALSSGANSVNISLRRGNRASHYDYQYTFYRRKSSLEFNYYGCYDDKRVPFVMFFSQGTTLRVTVSSYYAKRYRPITNLSIKWRLNAIYVCRFGLVHDNNCYVHRNKSLGLRMSHFFKISKQRRFFTNENYLIIDPFAEYLTYKPEDYVTMAEFKISATDSAGEELQVMRPFCYVLVDDDFYVPWPPYGSNYVDGRSRPQLFSTRNVLYPHLPLYRQPRALHNKPIDLDIASDCNVRRGALIHCGETHVTYAERPFRVNDKKNWRVFGCRGVQTRCMCLMLVTREIANNKIRQAYVGRWLRNGTRAAAHYIHFTYFDGFHVPRMQLWAPGNNYRFSDPNRPIDILIGCVRSEMKRPTDCERYKRRIWWQVSPPLPLATDRMDILAASIQGLTKYGTSYNFRARARWGTLALYDLSLRVTTAPSAAKLQSPFLKKFKMSPVPTPMMDWYKYYRAFEIIPPIVDYNADPYFADYQQFQETMPDLHKIYAGHEEGYGIFLVLYERSRQRGDPLKRVILGSQEFVPSPAFNYWNDSLRITYTFKSVYGTKTSRSWIYKFGKDSPEEYNLEALRRRILYFKTIYSFSIVSAIAGFGYAVITSPVGFNFTESSEKLLLEYIDWIDKVSMPDVPAMEQVIRLMVPLNKYFHYNETLITGRFEQSTLKIYEKVVNRLATYISNGNGGDIDDVTLITQMTLELHFRLLFRTCRVYICDLMPERRLESAGAPLYPDIASVTETLEGHDIRIFNTFKATMESLFTSAACTIRANHIPLYWRSSRDLLVFAFNNVAPHARSARVRDVYFYGSGFSARFPIMDHSLNVKTGMVLLKRNLLRHVTPQPIDTNILMMRFYQEPSHYATRYFENITRHKTHNPTNHLLVSLKVVQPEPPTWITGAATENIIYYRILTDATADLLVIFHATGTGSRRRERDMLNVGWSQSGHPNRFPMRIPLGGARVFIPRTKASGAFTYLGFAPSDPPVRFNISIYMIECLAWDSEIDDWHHVCEVMEDMSRIDTWSPKAVSCKCSDLNLDMAGQIYAAPIQKELSKDSLYDTIKLRPTQNSPFMSFEDFLPVMVVLIVFLVLFAAACYLVPCYRTPYVKGLHTSSVVYLKDNVSTHTYPYLLGVETDWRYRAGTTSNVCFQLFGANGKSLPHLLNYRDVRVLYPGKIVYFLLKTRDTLGQLLYLKLWHDSSGLYPDWYCKKVNVWDLRDKGRVWIFNVDCWLRITYMENPSAKAPAQSKVLLKNEKLLMQEYYHLNLLKEHPFVCLFVTQPRSVYKMKQRVAVLGAVLAFQMGACACLVGVPCPAPMALIREGREMQADHIIMLACWSALCATALNFWLVYLFRNARVPKHPKKSLPMGLCGAPFLNSYLSEGADGATCKRAGSIITSRGYGMEYIPPPVKLDCAGLSPLQRKWKAIHLYPLGWFFTLNTLIIGIMVTFIVGSYFNDIRSWEFVCLFVLSILIHVGILEPAKALFMTIVASGYDKTVMDEVGELNSVVVSDLYQADYPGRSRAERLARNLRRASTTYRPLSDKTVKARYVNSTQMYDPPSITSFLWSLLMLWLLMKTADLYWPKTTYYSHRSARDIFVNAKYGGQILKEDPLLLDDIYDKYINVTLVEALHPLPEPTEAMPWIVDEVHKAIGVARLRQVRAMELPPCPSMNIPAFQNFVWRCNDQTQAPPKKKKVPKPGATPSGPAPAAAVELDALAAQGFALSGLAREAHVMQSNVDAGALSTIGVNTKLPGSGFVMLLGRNRHNTYQVIKFLKGLDWIDRKTTAVFFELTMYNNDARAFVYLSVLLERIPNGYFVTSDQVWAALLLTPASLDQKISSFFIVGFTIAIIFLSLIYMIAIDAQRTCDEVFQDYWRYIDTAMFAMALSTMCMMAVRAIFGAVMSEDLDKYTSRRFISAHGAMICDEKAATLFGITIFFAILRTLKYLSFDDPTRLIGLSLSKSIGNVLSWSVGYFIIVGGCAFSQHLLLWFHFKDYRDAGSSFTSVLSKRSNRVDNGLDLINGGYLSSWLYTLSKLMLYFIKLYFSSFLFISFKIILNRPVSLNTRMRKHTFQQNILRIFRR